MQASDPNANRQLPGPADWWRGAVIYQIYPRSFQDTNGDGIGDLAGITARLDHVAGLGVDAIWISPFFTSPMKDFGYDVADYRDVDPMFGRLADFDALVARAHALGLRVMIDLVLSHTSDQHPWFQDSRAGRDGAYADWYVWADPKPDGTVPNNWPAVFGGPAWAWNGKRMQYYLHNFLASQPDLNFHNPAVQDAMLDVADFWLKRGVDGFRLDTINFYFHDMKLRDNPPLPPGDRNGSVAPLVNPYNWQEHIYSKNRPENIEFLRRFRSLMDVYGAAAVGEVGDAQQGLALMGQYTSGDDLMQMCYSFDFLSGERLTAPMIEGILGRLMAAAPHAWPCWAISNHDMPRHISRWGLSDAGAKAYATLLMCLRGSVCLYQGEELGLSEADIAYDDLQDPYGREFWPEFKGRDGCRTPMVWVQDNRAGGFTTGKPWLPVPSEHLSRAVDRAEADADSLLHHYRRALALRHRHPALTKGEQRDLRADGDILSFRRTGDGEDLFIAANLSAHDATVAMPAGVWAAVDLSDASPSGNRLTLAAWAVAILARRG